MAEEYFLEIPISELFEDKNSLHVLVAQILSIHSGQNLDKEKPIKIK